jgi:hypothetical protein
LFVFAYAKVFRDHIANKIRRHVSLGCHVNEQATKRRVDRQLL